MPRLSRSEWAGLAAVAAVALLASLAGIGNELVQDDHALLPEYIGRLKPGNRLELVTRPYWPPPYYQDHYRPLTSVLLAVQWALGAGAPLIFRLVSYLLYAAMAAGVFCLARLLMPWRIALGAALLFAAHPVHVEAAALAVGQSELLVGLFAVAMTLRYLDCRRAGSGSLSLKDWSVLGGLYLAAGLTKEHGLVLPALLLAVEVFLVPATPGRSRVGLIPGYGLLAAIALLLLAVRAAVLSGGISGATPSEALLGVGVGGRVLTLLAMVPQWARLLLWPAHLQSDYAPQELTASNGLGSAEALGLALLLGAAAAAWWGRRRMPVVSLGLAWTAIALFPVSNLVVPTGILLAERTLFLASIGVVVALGGVVAAALGSEVRTESPGWMVLQLGCMALVIAGVVRSAARERIWQNKYVLTAASVADAPQSYRMQKAWGEELFHSGHREQGIQAYRTAMTLAPPHQVWRVRNDLARRFWEEGANGLAVEELRASLALAPEQEETRNYLVLGYLALGRYDEAAREADVALALGYSPREFAGLRALADSAVRAKAPPGSIRLRIHEGPPPRP